MILYYLTNNENTPYDTEGNTLDMLGNPVARLAIFETPQLAAMFEQDCESQENNHIMRLDTVRNTVTETTITKQEA